MKTIAVVVSMMLALSPLAGAQGLSMAQQVGPQQAGDNTQTRLRADRTSAQVITGAHGDYNEAAIRGQVMHLDSDSVTLAAANATKSALGTVKLINGFYNPTTSQKAASILRAIVANVSGTPAGGFFFNYICGVTVTNSNTGTIRSGVLSNNSAPSAMQPEVNVTITVSGAATTAMNQLMALSGPTNIVLGSGIQSYSEDLKGQIVVPPGCLFGLSAAGAGTSHIVQSSLSWEEVPYP